MAEANRAPDLKRTGVGERLHGLFLISGVEQRSYGDGKDCLLLTFANASGSIVSSPLWNAKREAFGGLARGDAVEVRGEISSYRGRRQLEIASLCLVPPASVDWASLLPSIGNVAPCWERLDARRAAIRGPRLRRVLSLFYDDDRFRRAYGACPGSPVGHHAALGGLLRHTWEVASIGEAIAATSGANADLVVAGALLHDIGKLEAYRWSGPFETTEPGALLGHVALGMLMLSRRIAAEPEPPCTEPELLLLQHLIASHHGKPEFGATAAPMTLEAEVLHFADDASAKTASMADALANPDNFPGGARLSARGVWQLDRRRVYRAAGECDWGS
jgi:3'-5' exoribonuclease